ncbi:YqaA family protein [Falsiroseomonas ponticola]|jgi:membrane protein YqaA with SNARE-associated domain|uniref:YqaA family protein n=1 Tax=Falsiroseomonas ponticola TaxID=2786951 RepID=UPI00193147F5|nr:YqaA family protein [Roseomonas ponticola]
MTELLALLGLFASAFGAASLLPLQSEPVLVGLLLLGETPPWLLVLVASIGNTLGAALNWWLGRQVDRFRDRRWFPVPPQALDRATGWYHRWGRWSLLLSWAPIIGDPLTLVAGVLKEPIGTFLLLVAIAKTGRYVVLAWATLSLA